MADCDVASFYANRSVLVTGATGFLGKALIEKLLRSIPQLKSIYVLVRPLKGKSIEERWKKVLEDDLFDSVRNSVDEIGKCPLDKVVLMRSDMMQPALGLSEDDAERLRDDVSVVFHGAATIQFNEPIRSAVRMNILGTERLLRLCDGMRRLQAFVHVSTAFCNCDRRYIMECVYPSPVSPEKLMDIVEWMNDEMLEAVTPALLGRKPNTYTMTKAVTETLLVQDHNQHLPISIVRPSIVCGAWKDPKPGWVDNYNGANGLMAMVMKGLVRAMYGRPHEVKADLVPVDIVANALVVAGWYRGIQKDDPVTVMHVSSDRLNPITWGGFIDAFSDVIKERLPLSQLYREPDGRTTIWRFEYDLRILIDHLLPAYLTDCVLLVLGKRRGMVKLYGKILKVIGTFEQFYTNHWEHQSRMIMKMNDRLSAEDRKRFYIDIREVDWAEYVADYCAGIRKYVLKEDASTIPEGFRVRRKRRLILGALKMGLCAVIVRCCIWNTGVGETIWSWFMLLVTTVLGN